MMQRLSLGKFAPSHEGTTTTIDCSTRLTTARVARPPDMSAIRSPSSRCSRSAVTSPR